VILITGNTGTYKLLIFSQVILSLQLPFAIVPLVKFTSSPLIMNDFVNPIWVKILSYAAAVFVIIFNIYLASTQIIALMSKGTVYLVLSIIFIIPLCLGLIVLLGYLLWAKPKAIPYDYLLTSTEEHVSRSSSTIEMQEIQDISD